MNPVKYQFLDLSQYIFVYCMLLISFIPLAAIARSKDTSSRIGVASSFSTKLAMIILVFGIYRGDAGMLILSLMEMER